METFMIHKSIGLLRNLINKRSELIRTVKEIAIADNVIVITVTDSIHNYSGHTANDAMTLYMLGKTLGCCYAKAAENNVDATMEEYFSQPTAVALAHMNSIGMLK